MKVKQLILAALLLAPNLTFAAETAKQKVPEPPPAPVEGPPPPFQPQLLKLAETMGSIAFLADLCPDLHAPGEDGTMWRGKAANLAEAEANGPRLKGLLAGAYNRGYLSYEVNYQACTEAAKLSFVRDLAAINTLAAELARRYSGN
jgi:uncharacterized protein (TIGR02301 family)